MRKLILLALVLGLSATSVYSYSPTTADDGYVDSLSRKAYEYVDKKGESFRSAFLSKLAKLKARYSSSERLTYILWSISQNVEKYGKQANGSIGAIAASQTGTQIAMTSTGANINNRYLLCKEDDIKIGDQTWASCDHLNKDYVNGTFALDQMNNVCASGYRLPTRTDFEILVKSLSLGDVLLRNKSCPKDPYMSQSDRYDCVYPAVQKKLNLNYLYNRYITSTILTNYEVWRAYEQVWRGTYEYTMPEKQLGYYTFSQNIGDISLDYTPFDVNDKWENRFARVRCIRQ